MAGPIKHPDFAHRMQQACEQNPKIPLPNYGRLGWFVKQLQERFDESVTQETIRKWFAGESRPRHRTIGYLASIMDVEPTWLNMGHGDRVISKEKKILNASAGGVVNLLAGMIQISGGTPAFPEKEGPVDLTAIIKGAVYNFHLVLGEPDGSTVSFCVSLDSRETLVLGVVPRGDLIFEVYELDWEKIEDLGSKRSGYWLVETDSKDIGTTWKRITSFGNII